jgi:two-component system sensor histidine kinase HydH
MIPKISHDSRWNLHTSPWVIIGSVGILLVVVVVLAAQNYSREKKYMSRILSEKGAAVIKAVEAGARTGMMGMMWGEQQVQTLIEETALQPDLLYITVTNRNGLVLASSNRELIGTQMNPSFFEVAPKLSETISWRFKDIDNQQQSFEVSRIFEPISSRDEGKSRKGTMMEPDNDRCCLQEKADREQIILVGLDPKPFQDARREDIRNTTIISGVLVVLGLAGFISMLWMQS